MEERGVRLFTYLAEAANGGKAIGISYGGFLAYLHGVDEFREVAGRNFLPSDSMAAVRIAWSPGGKIIVRVPEGLGRLPRFNSPAPGIT